MKQAVRLFLTGLILFSFLQVSFGQSANVGIGQWRVYQPNQNAKMVADAGDKIYCVTETGFFYYDKEFNNTKTLSKLDGLHDNGISTIAYDKATKTLLVAYQNTNLDLIRGEEIINVNDILRKSIPGEKAIYHIYFKDKLAYLSCSFGLVVLDMVKLEIRDSYVFQGSAGTNLKVFAATTLRDSIYISTSNGIRVAKDQRNVNLSDPKNWKQLNSGFPASEARQLVTYSNGIYAGVSRSGVYKLSGNNWVSVMSMGQQLNQLNVAANGLLVSNEYNLMVYNPAKPTQFIDTLIAANRTFMEDIRAALQDSNGDYWIAEYNNGLIHYNGKTFQLIIPNGPASANTFKLYSDNQSLVVLGGGYFSAGQFDSDVGFYEFKNGTWENYNMKRFPYRTQYPDVFDLVDAVRDPVSGKLFIATFAKGVLEWGGPGDYKLHTLGNSTLVSTLPPNDHNYNRFVQVTDVEFDAEGNLWVANPSQYSNQASLHVYRRESGWQKFDLKNTADGTGFSNAHTFGKIVIDDNGYKWLAPRLGIINGGVVVYDDKANRFRHFTSGATTGNLPSGTVNCLVKDKNGEIWLGTEKGVARFVNPDQAFSASSISASIPGINRRPLLEDQSVKAIAVDGANRKWMGTDNGVWLFSPDGDEQIYNFTTANSPLPSDKITDIAINNTSGDVFIGTEAGLVSFRAGATVTESLNCANVFPNPVRPGYTGEIGISGLFNNGIVKITDVTGKLVYETKATGGTAIWNGKDYNGKKVKTGVYLVMSSNADGEETCMSKVAVVE